MKRFQVAASTAAIALLIAVAAGTMAGSWATAKAGKTIPILMATQASTTSAKVTFEDGFAPIAKHVVPAVVNVSSSKVIRTPGGNISSPFFSDPFFRQFFGNSLPQNFQTPPSEEREHSLGSGVIVNPDGYILTNNHVIDGAKDIQVSLGDKREFQARVVGTDATTDIAVLKVDAKDLPVLAFGDSSKMQVGHFVLAIGNPFGLNQTVTLGIVSATGRNGLGIEDYEDFIQTDAAINPGNSGGALVDERGDLIGINTAIVSGGSGGNQGVGFAIPGNMARNVMDQILKNGKVTRAWLGVSIQPVKQDIAKAFHLSGTYGALIGDVTKDGPAAKSGLETGDIVLDVDGEKIQDSQALQLKIGNMSPGTTVKLTVFRNGVTQEIPVKLGEKPGAAAAQTTVAGTAQRAAMRGISVDALTPDVSSQLKLPASTKGVVVTNVDPASAASEAGILQGDVIQEVNRQPVTGIPGFNRVMQSAGNQPALLLINRNGMTSFVVVPAQ
ncbi:MAG: DegQ family serine endoprotease [Bryobacteraceae bacterium]